MDEQTDEIFIHPEDRELIADYKKGMKYRELLAKHELSHVNELYLILNEYKIPLRKSHDNIIARREKVISMYRKGYRKSEIAAMTGVALTTVLFIIKTALTENSVLTDDNADT